MRKTAELKDIARDVCPWIADNLNKPSADVTLDDIDSHDEFVRAVMTDWHGQILDIEWKKILKMVKDSRIHGW